MSWTSCGADPGGASAIRPRQCGAVRAQLDRVTSWDDFLRTRVALDPAALVDEPTRERLEALPGDVRIRGDAAPLDYEMQDGQGMARVRLREGQAKRLRAGELPALDRPLRFAVQRGRHEPILAERLPTSDELRKRRGHRGARTGGPVRSARRAGGRGPSARAPPLGRGR